MKDKEKKSGYHILRFLPFAVCIIIICAYLFSDAEINPNSIVSYAPENTLKAVVFLLLLYAVKSLTIFIPIIIMHIAGGFMFSTPLALIVNITGTAISLTLPYIVGRISGSDLVDRINRKFPKLEKTINNTQGSNFFLCFILRSVSCLPGDAISMFMGARRMPFQTYFWGSLSGTILSIITATLIGSSITNPSSPMFWISVGLTVIISVGSIIVYFLWGHRKRKKEV